MIPGDDYQVMLMDARVISMSFYESSHGKCHKSGNLQSSENGLSSVNSWNFGTQQAGFAGV